MTISFDTDQVQIKGTQGSEILMNVFGHDLKPKAFNELLPSLNAKQLSKVWQAKQSNSMKPGAIGKSA